MPARLIAMLTHRDETVEDARLVFDECSDLENVFWGFKDVGLPKKEMRALVRTMKDKGKTTFLEVVSLGEKECLEGAQLSLDCGFDFLMGTRFWPSVLRMMKGKATRFYPFCGKVSGHPSVLEGSIEEVVNDAQRMEELGVDGFDLLAYRYVGEAEMMAEQVLRRVNHPVVVAGSIDSLSRVEAVKRLGPWAFTIGGAFFERRFVPGGSFIEQIRCVLSKLDASTEDAGQEAASAPRKD